jgi:ATP-binding cassette, subfamily C, bacterial LapB
MSTIEVEAPPDAQAPAAPAQDNEAPQPQRYREDLIHPDPLLDCLIEVCRVHGKNASRASLTAGLPLPQGSLTLEVAARAAARTGMSAKLQRIALDAIDAAALPVILLLKDNRACVLSGWTRGEASARLLLPEVGQGSVALDKADLLQRYSGVALFVRPNFSHDLRASEPERAASDGHWFWSSLLQQRFIYQDVLWSALLVNVFALALPMFSMNVYDRVVPNNALETLWALAVGLSLVLAADVLMRMLRVRFVDEASARIDVQVSATLMEHVLAMKLKHRPASVGAFASNLRGFEQVRDFAASGTVTALVDLPFALLFVAALAWISPWLALPVIVVGVAILLIGALLQHRLHELSQTTYQAGAMRNATLVEALTGIETIKSQVAEGEVQAKWERANEFLATTGVKMRGLSAAAMIGTNVLSQAVTMATVVIGVYLIAAHELTMGALIAAGMLASRALAPAGQVVGLMLQFQSARTALRNLDEVMEKSVERPASKKFVQRAQFRGEIEFRNVEFAYPGRSENALEGLSFKVKAGEHVALIGRVGSGKSTIQRLILGLYRPTKGTVLLDGIDQRQLDPADVRRNAACVSQDVMLFQGSLRENITLGMPYAEDAAVVAAAELAGLAEFVNRHPRGFDMPVGERGDMLSGGQRQAVGLARAVLHNSPVLLLDEPTSAMDFSTEARVTADIAAFAKDKTIVLVTHRTSLLSLATRVIVIDAGRVVADGPRDRIMAALASGRIAGAAA